MRTWRTVLWWAQFVVSLPAAWRQGRTADAACRRDGHQWWTASSGRIFCRRCYRMPWVEQALRDAKEG